MAAFLARRYAEVVVVQRGDDAPARFVWRGRHYTVREVLAHWIRTGAWWQQAALAVASGGAAASDDGGEGFAVVDTAPLPPSPRWGQRAWGEPAPDVGIAATLAEIDDDEREFWRVEAATAGSRTAVVVELCFRWADGTWLMTAVGD